MELSKSNNKKYLIFSQKKAFLIFWQTETTKKFLIFQEMELSYISGSNILCSKNEKKPTLKMFLIFRERERSSPTFKEFLIFLKVLSEYILCTLISGKNMHKGLTSLLSL